MLLAAVTGAIATAPRQTQAREMNEGFFFAASALRAASSAFFWTCSACTVAVNVSLHAATHSAARSVATSTALATCVSPRTCACTHVQPHCKMSNSWYKSSHGLSTHDSPVVHKTLTRQSLIAYTRIKINSPFCLHPSMATMVHHMSSTTVHPSFEEHAASSGGHRSKTSSAL